MYGKVEAGKVVKGLRVSVMPIGIMGEVLEIIDSDENEFTYANAGENVKLKIRIPEEIEIWKGYVICDIHDDCHANTEFKAIVEFLDLLEKKPIVTKGYQCILHIHTAVEECVISEVIALIDTARRKKVACAYGKSNQKLMVNISTASPICVENYVDVPALGRFTLRDEGKTIATGRVIDLISKTADELGF